MQRFIGIHYVIFFVGLIHFAKAQDHAIKFENLNSENGLANEAIQHMIQDSKGFMWFGTAGGLHKFDGHDVTVYRHSDIDSASLSNNTTLFILEDRANTLWIGTRNGLNRHNSNTHDFTSFKSGFGNETLLDDKSIRFIHEDAEGYLWLAVSEIGLLRFDKEKGEFDRKINDQTGLGSNHIKTIFEDESGNFWLGSDNGLILFNRRNHTFVNYLPQADNANSLPDRYIKAIYKDRKGNFWIGTDNGLSYAERKGDSIVSFTNYHHHENPSSGLSNDFVKSILEDEQGKIWIATDDGLNIFDPVTKTFHHHNHEVDNALSLINKNCRFLMKDRQGIIWIGTDGGVSKYDEGRFPFNIYRHNPNNRNSLLTNFVTAVCEDRTGMLWIGTNEGLNSYDRKNDRFKSYARKTDASFLGNDVVSAITEDKNGSLWVGSNTGLHKLSADRAVIKKYYSNQSINVSTVGVLSLLANQDGTLLVGKWDGLDIYDSLRDSFQAYHRDVIQERVQALFEDSNGELWIGTRNKLVRIRKDEKKKDIVHIYRHIPGDTSSLSYNSINTLCETDQDGIWIGTAGGGLNYFDKKTEKFTRYTWDDGLPSDNVSAIIGHHKTLWISTDKGLTRFDIASKIFTTYDKSDGLQSNAFNQGVAFKSGSGEFFFGGPGGLNSFFPDKLKANAFTPPVYITEFQLFNKPLYPGKNKILPVSIENMSKLELTHEERVFTLGFVALNFRNPSKNRYAYKMENFDRDWIFTNSDRRFASYSNLKPGKYIFRVKAANNDGVWNKKESQLEIIILPPFWETWWFYTLCVVLATGAILLYVWLRLRSLRNIQAKLVKEVAARTQELNRKKERLEMANKQISDHADEIEAQKELIELDRERLEKAQKIITEQNAQLLQANASLEEKVRERTSELKNTVDELDFFVYRASHDLRGPIARMEGLCHVGQLEPDSKEAYKYLKKLEEVCQETHKMLSRLLRTRTISNKEIKSREISLNRTIEKVLKSVLSTENAKNISFKIDVRNDVFFRTDPELIDILLDNVIQNAIRYQNHDARESYIRISGSCLEDSKILISIEDNGIGIPEELRRNVFEMFFIGTERSSGFGLGLYEAKLIAKKLGGSIELNNQKKDSTEIQITLPANPAS